MKRLAYILVGILGVWLLYWNITEFITLGLDTGVWDTTIVTNGLTSIIFGVILILIFYFRGIKVLK